MQARARPSFVLYRRLAALALALPLVVLLSVLAHSLWRGHRGVTDEQRALYRGLERHTLTLTPAGIPPRQGPGPHRAIDRRHSPQLPPPGFGGAR